MKIIKIFFITLFGLLVLGITTLYATGHDYILTSLQRTYLAGNITANINDHREFEVSTIRAGSKGELPKHPNYNKKQPANDFINEAEQNKAAAFLVLKDGQIIFETYLNGYDDRSRTNSFSMAKTVTTMLLGIAIAEGHVTGLDQPITDFIPEFANDPMGKHATIGQMSLMNSGYEWVEAYYTPFSPTVQLYYGDDVTKFLVNREFSAEPGTFWEYSSASTQLMGIFLKRALIKAGAAETLTEYLSKKLWQPMQMNDDALWHLDDSGMELVYCCINTNARNFAKLGLLMMNHGNWQGQQLIPAEFVQQMSQPAANPDYGLSTWLATDASPAFYGFSGHLGQAIINVPEHNMVVVRLGEQPRPLGYFINGSWPKYVEAGLSVLP